MTDLLGEPARSLFATLAHAGDPPVPVAGDTAAAAAAPSGRWVTGQAGCQQHGTCVRFALCVGSRSGAGGHQVLEARYRAYGCPHTLAACEWVARQLQGCELSALSPAALAQAVGGPLEWARDLAVPQPKLGRLLVIEDALRAALCFDPVVTKGA